MQLKILSRRKLIMIIFVGVAISAVLIFYFIQQSDDSLANKQDQNNLVLSHFGQPVRLKIQEINVDASIEYVGVTSGGAMGVPKNQDNVAWFKLGQRPGEDGSAVIAGHYGLRDNKPSVFDNLHKLTKGDKLYIEDDAGKIIFFVVREIKSYNPQADATEIFNSNDGKSHLNLITCEGTWDKVSKTYSQRLVIFTDRE